ncbi:hypothetical protein FJT64_023246 [Amphibalanus amphitrite]|uniref:Peptidase A2 domain-containing protein n=1 Tax=Amphibalanus amphitrite TaxID=1232801 RepID=A0A6A4WSD3_AMPAM|nr:hypothetical protein FJT64_023246 [Amphibalanus amphitrite]
MGDHEQLERLTALMVQQSEQAAQREERLAAMLERALASQTQPPAARSAAAVIEGGQPATIAAATTTAPLAKLPSGAITAPHLTSSASLKEFGAWRQKFADFQLLTRLGTLSIDEQKATLTSLLDDEWTRTLRYSLQVPQDANLETVLDIMEAHLRGQRSIILDRRDFYSRIQEPDEMFDDFLSSIKEIAAYCDFCDVCVDDQYRDRVVVGTRDEEALKRMLHEPKLTLQKAIDICRASHVSAAGDRSGVRQLIGDIHVDQLATRRTPRVELMLTHPSGSAAVSCVPDTGAEATVMGAEMAASLSIPLQTTPSSGSAVKFSSAGNTPLTCIGQFGATVTLGDSEIYTTVYVLQEVTGLLLGWCDAVRLRILPADFPAQIPAATWRRHVGTVTARQVDTSGPELPVRLARVSTGRFVVRTVTPESLAATVAQMNGSSACGADGLCVRAPHRSRRVDPTMPHAYLHCSHHGSLSLTRR